MSGSYHWKWNGTGQDKVGIWVLLWHRQAALLQTAVISENNQKPWSQWLQWSMKGMAFCGQHPVHTGEWAARGRGAGEGMWRCGRGLSPDPWHTGQTAGSDGEQAERYTLTHTLSLTSKLYSSIALQFYIIEVVDDIACVEVDVSKHMDSLVWWLCVCCPVVEVVDSSKVVGTLTVSVEALEALRSIMDDPEHDHTPVSHLQPATWQRHTTPTT